MKIYHLLFSDIAVTPSHRHIITPSHHYLCSSLPSHNYLDSGQAHRHAVASPLLQLAVTSPLLQLAFISVNGEDESPRCYRGGRSTRGERRYKKMREDEEEEEKNIGFHRLRRRLAVEDDRSVVCLFTDGILDY
ncbi:hypothetical protein HID58_069340 [Brassica napus]|uniref:Protein-serine/threonine phosphatase n=3 Tax=Brassica TaxID=3705 RepID=A0ABQ7YVS0_BRANA|nr:hypothetical protein F2Q68_00043059 [Brassica cretica]KAF3518553.1 hypothetical protein DY000_02058549 [Brassica cretica]KAH0871978.1 hypothetical protein HID58_069340 [Brassica napus]